MKYWKASFYMLGTFPFLFCISMLTFYFHAALVLGYLPRYNQPDPKELDFYNYYEPIITWTSGIWFFSFVLWFLLTIIYLILKRKHIKWQPLIFSTFGQLCAIAIIFSGILEWFAD